MANKGFTHLHLHSQYSLLDGAITFEGLLNRCKQLEMDSVAVTDHGNMFGALEFYIKAQKEGIKPIIGVEAYIAPGSRFDKQKSSISDAAYHLILLAENNTGYKNLLKLSSAGFTEGFYYRPRIDKEILAEFNEGIVCSSACQSGELAKLLLAGDEKGAVAAAESYAKIFGENRFFVELQKHEDEDINIRQALIDLAAKVGLGLLATNDAHFLDEDDYEAHNCLCCISTGKNFDDPDRMIYPRDVYVKSGQQMREMFAGVEEACDNTVSIAARCNVELDLKSRHSPVFKPEDGSKPEEFLTNLCYERAEKIYGKINTDVRNRLERELTVIKSKGFASYFLIVWDFCNYAHRNNIPVGARGSGVGTLVGYCLGLCDVDPIRYDLLFERFMDPERNEMPDIDIDICQMNRPKIIEYVRQKYGHVAQIITFGTMKARAVIRDICRVMNVPLSEADRLAKLVPEALEITLEKALDSEPQLKDAYEQNEQTRKVIDICRKLEGLVRHASVHAAGVVIAEEPLMNFIPLYKPSDSEDIITQFEGPLVEKAGLLKMDFLGLKTLSVLERAKQLVKEIHGVEIDLEKIDLKDKKVFKLFAAGRTKGVFQFESGGMQDMLIKMKPDRLEDLIAANALYRPGPMTLIPDYIARKHGEKWDVPHPIMKEILEETYGIMVYQEQVMRISNRLGDIPLREAYTMIKAISKKQAGTIAKGKKDFIAGCGAKGLSATQAQEIFELIERFAGYGFNKSHSTRYSFIAYQTAYLKAHWPVEFMAALLTYEMSSTEKVVDYIGECSAMGIEVMAPDINESGVDFTPLYKENELTAEHAETAEEKHKKNSANSAVSAVKKGLIRFGLAAVKGVGEKAVEQIIAARQKTERFKSLFHFCENVDLRAANKQVIEALIKAGAFDKLGGSRSQMLAALEPAMENGAQVQSDRQSGQMSFFGSGRKDDERSKDYERLPKTAPWTEQQMLAYEKQVLGFYVTSNPLSHCAETINVYSTANCSELGQCGKDRDILIGGMVTKIRTHLTKKGKNAGAKMAVFVLEDLQGSAEVVLWPEIFQKYGELVAEDRVVFVKGKVDNGREKPNIFADELIALEQVAEKIAAKVNIKLYAHEISREKVDMIKHLCERHKGRSPVFVSIKTDHGRVYARAHDSLSVKADVDFCKKMRELVGQENFQMSR